jgi:hypothetical protein
LTAQCATIAAALLSVLGLLIGGSLHSATTEQGVLEVRVKDHREAIGDFSRLTLKLGKIAISPKPGLTFWKTDWRELTPSLQTIDLTKYTGKESAAIFTGMLNSGTFDALQLKVDGIEAFLKKNQSQVPVKNLLTPIKLSFAVEPKGKTVIILDLAVFDMSDHPPRAYELGIKGYELFVNGKLLDKVPPG